MPFPCFKIEMMVDVIFIGSRVRRLPRLVIIGQWAYRDRQTRQAGLKVKPAMVFDLCPSKIK